MQLAGELFAEKGYRATTVREIADAAGILSGSLYHHFDSKESIVDELLRAFLDGLWARYREVEASELSPKARLEAIVATSFEAIDAHPAEVSIFQNDAKYLRAFDRFSYLDKRNEEFRRLWLDLLRDGVAAGQFRADIDEELTFRFIRDTVWVAVHWYRP